MAQQQRDVAELKRRALEAGAKRRQNLSKIEEKRRGERERDRTVLRAKHVPVKEEEEGGGEGNVEGGEAGGDGTGKDESLTASVSEVSEVQAPAVSVVKTVKRKKKARQADIQ